MGFLTRTARLTSWAGLTAAGAVHAAWAAGSSWPAKNTKQLAASAVGSSKEMPSTGATAAVAGLAFTGAAVSAGALGEGKAIVGVRRAAGLALIARAAFGGAAALKLLGLPAPGKRFEELDRRFYRPAFAVLGSALIIGAKDRKKRATQLALKNAAR